MKRVAAIAAIVDLLFLALAFYTSIKDFLFEHQWLLSALAAAPALVIAFLEYRHSGEANELRRDANRYRQDAIEQNGDANRFREEANAQRREANEQRDRATQALAQIATHTKKTPSKAEKNAERLQQYIGAKVRVVGADDSKMADGIEIAEIKDEIVTLFTPAGMSSSAAMATYVHCENLEIVEVQVGSTPVTLKILKRYGTDHNLGQIKSWGERNKPEAAPVFPKGGNVFNAEYLKPGSAERRRLDVFDSADGLNSYMLVANPGDTLYGDNVVISRNFMLIQLEFEKEGFRYNGGGSGGGKYPLFIKTKA